MKLQLFCLAHAGGGVGAYYRWRHLASESLLVLPLCLPGRESRFRDGLLVELEAILVDLERRVIADMRDDYALFGHSMGGLLAYELAARLSARGRPPRFLSVASCRPPHFGPHQPMLHRLDDDQLIVELGRRYGDHGDTLNHPEARRVFLPVIRADLQALETYQRETYPPLECPVLVMAGRDDRSVSSEQLSDWARYTTAKLQCEWFPGGHFFVHDQREAVVSQLELSAFSARCRDSDEGVG